MGLTVTDLNPVHDAQAAAGALLTPTATAIGKVGSAAVGSLLGSFGIVPQTIVGGLVKALLYVVFIVAGMGLIILGLARLTGSHVPSFLKQAGSDAAVAAVAA